jgi:hypothetical protein
MARIKNLTPLGSPPRDVARDASIFHRWLKNAVGDAALASDKMTGLNAEVDTINHSGGVRGCPMMLPPVSTACEIDLTSTVGKEYYVWSAPIYVPPSSSASDDYVIEADLTRSGAVNSYAVEIRSFASWALVQGGALNDLDAREAAPGARIIGSLPRQIHQTVLPLAPGWQVLLIRANIPVTVGASERINGVRVYRKGRAFRDPNNGFSPLSTSGTAQVNIYPVPATLSSSLLTFDDVQVEVDGPMDGYVLTRLNRGMNALWEYVTGAPVPGHNARTMPTTVDNNTAPAPSLAMPMGSWGTSAVNIDVDGIDKVAPGIAGFARYPTAEIAATTISQVRLQFPNFLFATNPLKCRVIVWQKAGAATNWRFNTTTGAGSSSVVAVTMIGATGFGYVDIVDANYTSGTEQTVSLNISHAAPGVFSDEIYLMGWSLAFDP